METIKDRLRKIEALAKAGIAGEAETARRMLFELQKKYGVTLEELSTETKHMVKFYAKNAAEALLLNQCLVSVCETSRIRHRWRGRTLLCELTPSQEIDVRACFHHHRKPLERHLKEACQAYIYTNRLFINNPDATHSSEPSEEVSASAMRIAAMMRAMEPTPWRKRKSIAQ